MSDPIIKIQNMNKWFGDFQVLKNINLEVEANKKIVVCGPSGSGKSTLIRCINRLEEHQEGDIIVDGNELSEKTKDIEKIRAEVGMVFQQFNLFPHLSILDNCTLAPIWVKKMPKKVFFFPRDFFRFKLGVKNSNSCLLPPPPCPPSSNMLWSLTCQCRTSRDCATCAFSKRGITPGCSSTTRTTTTKHFTGACMTSSTTIGRFSFYHISPGSMCSETR